MRIALIARCDNTGLGNQTFEFYTHVKPAKTLVVDFREVNGKPQYPSRYLDRTHKGDLRVASGWLSKESIEWLTDGIDILFTCEIDYTEGRYDLIKRAKQKGVKVVMQYNYEFLDHLVDPRLPLPDLLLAPSKWFSQEVESAFGHRCRVEYLPVPVAKDRFEQSRKKKARNFIHIAGPGNQLDDRNGTKTVIDSLFYIQSEKIKFTIYSQRQLKDIELPADAPFEINLVSKDIDNYTELYKGADVLVFPRKYGGLCLPLNEAMAAGVIPIMPNVEPQNEFLHPLMLTPVNGVKEIMTRALIPSFSVDPRTLAMHIDNLVKSNKTVINELSEYAEMYSYVISWENLLPKYMSLFEEVIRGR